MCYATPFVCFCTPRVFSDARATSKCSAWYNIFQSCVKGREAIRIPFTRNDFTTFNTKDGRLLCKHGRARTTLLYDGKYARKHGKTPPAACGCNACPVPRRTGHNLIKVGACGDRRLTKKM